MIVVLRRWRGCTGAATCARGTFGVATSVPGISVCISKSEAVAAYRKCRPVWPVSYSVSAPARCIVPLVHAGAAACADSFSEQPR